MRAWMGLGDSRSTLAFEGLWFCG